MRNIARTLTATKIRKCHLFRVQHGKWYHDVMSPLNEKGDFYKTDYPVPRNICFARKHKKQSEQTDWCHGLKELRDITMKILRARTSNQLKGSWGKGKLFLL